MSRGAVLRFVVLWLALVCMPSALLAQEIAGVVKDASGAVLPGVTVEASSPALIEKVRSVASDDHGQYKIVDLRAGTYTVTFALTGFNTVKREGIELSVGFTAPVNVEMRVGDLAETVIVSGDAPIVDTQNVVGQMVLSKDVIDSVPTAKNVWTMALLVPGMTAGGAGATAVDVGGTNAEASSPMRIHGGTVGDQVVLLDGLLFGNLNGAGYSLMGVSMNDASTQEMVLQTSAISSEVPGGGGGLTINIVPKDGGNEFHGSAFGNFANHSMQGSNYGQDLQSQGLRTPDSLVRVWDQSVSLGGPIAKDRLWFFFAQRYWGSNMRRADTFYAKDPLAWVFVPDTTREQPIDIYPSKSGNMRLTWQLNEKNKIAAFYNRHSRYHENFNISRTISTDAATFEQHRNVFYSTVTYTSTINDRLLFEAGILNERVAFRSFPNSTAAAQPNAISTLEQTTGMRFRSKDFYRFTDNKLMSARAGITYVTGSHALKAGFSLLHGQVEMLDYVNSDINYTLRNGVPTGITLWATPWDLMAQVPTDLAVYLQDKWTIKRATLNLAIRYDNLHERNPAQSASGGIYVGPRTFAPVDDVPNWKDIGPRLGFAYDLFGDGKTALKASLSRYLIVDSTGYARSNNPINTSVNSANRSWHDDNGDYVPQCNFSNPAANLECGPLGNLNFGKVAPSTTYSPGFITGWFHRPYNWEFSAGVEHQLMPGVAAEVGYYRRWYGNLPMTDNVAVSPSDFDTFCITAPVDSRLPGGGGNQICGLYDVKPSKFGQSTNVIQSASSFGQAAQVFDGIDINMTARFGRRAFASGGMSTGRMKASFCTAIDNPSQFAVPGYTTSRFCEVAPPFQPNIKALGGYMFPWDVQVSGTIQSIPGPQITATWAVPNALISSSLGRNLAAGPTATYSVDLIQPGSLWGGRVTTMDVRVTKTFPVARARLQVMFDLYNAINSSPVYTLNTTYGPDWRKPSSTLQARFIKLGARLTF